MLFPFVESALANLKAGSRLNQGVVNFLELLQQLRPFFWRVRAEFLSLRATVSLSSLQVSAAIYECFPECSLFRRMKVFACPGAKRFLDTWPSLVSGTACELEEEATIASTFSEVNTQTAFMSIAARQKEAETTLRVQTAQLNVLTHRTEPLPPSCERSGVGVPDSPAPATHGSTSEREEEPLVAHRFHPTPSLPSPLCTHCGHHATSARDSGHHTNSPRSLPGLAPPVPCHLPPLALWVPGSHLVPLLTRPSRLGLLETTSASLPSIPRTDVSKF